jgi:hypothetical protein
MASQESGAIGNPKIKIVEPLCQNKKLADLFDPRFLDD